MQTLTHLQARDRIEKTQTDLLSAADLAALEAHLENCPDCRAYRARFRQDEAALRSALGWVARRPETDQGAVLQALTQIRSRVRMRRAAGLAGSALQTLSLAGLAVTVALGLNWVFTSFSQATSLATPEAEASEAAPADESVVPDAAAPGPGPTIPEADDGSAVPAPATSAPAPAIAPILGYIPFSRQLRLTLGLNGAAVRTVVFSPDGKTIAAGYSDGLVRIWRARDGAMLAVMEAHVKEATTLAFSADGAMLVTGGRDGAVKLWLAGSGAFIKTVYSGDDIVEAVQFSPSGELLAVTLDNFSVALIQIKSGNLIETLPSMVRLSVSTDVERNSTLTVSGETAIWLDAETNTPLGLNVVGRSSRSDAVVLSADGTLLASTSADGLIYLWRIVDITIVEENYDHNGNNLVFRFISGNLLYTLAGHTKWANHLDFSADGRYLVSASEDGSLILWSLEDGSPVVILTGHAGPVNTLDVSPDDTLIASGSDDGTVRIWVLTEK